MRKALSVVLRVHVCNRTIFSFGVASATESIFSDFEDTGSKLTREPGVANYTKFPSHSSPPPPPLPLSPASNSHTCNPNYRLQFQILKTQAPSSLRSQGVANYTKIPPLLHFPYLQPQWAISETITCSARDVIWRTV